MQLKLAARFSLIVTVAMMGAASAQQVTGTLGSPSATTTISRTRSCRRPTRSSAA